MDVTTPENYIKFVLAIGHRIPKGVTRFFDMMAIAEEYSTLTGTDVPCGVLWKNLYAEHDMDGYIKKEVEAQLKEAPFHPVSDFELPAEYKELIAKLKNPPQAVVPKTEPTDAKDQRAATPTDIPSSASSVTNSETTTPATTAPKQRKRKSASEQPEVEKSTPRLRKSESESNSTPKPQPKRKSAASNKEKPETEDANADSVKTRTRTGKGKADTPVAATSAKSTPQSESVSRSRGGGGDTTEKRKYEKRTAAK